MNTRELIQSALEWRYATRGFDSMRKISDQDWSTLAQTLLLAPSSYGLQPWKFLVVQNPDLRVKLRAATWNQAQVTDCSHYVVLLHKEGIDESYVKEYIERISEVRGVSVESLKGFYGAMLNDLVNSPRAETLEPWIQRQVYIAMGFLLQAAALLRVDACPIEGIDPGAYDEILKLKGSGYKSIASVALGYRRPDDIAANRKKVRFSLDRIFEYR